MNPQHGPWCNTKLFPIRCKHCKKKIYLFTCDHGSRVLFDRPQPPWPIHRCAESRAGWLKVDLGEAIIPKEQFYEGEIELESEDLDAVIYISDELYEELQKITVDQVNRQYLDRVRELLSSTDLIAKKSNSNARRIPTVDDEERVEAGRIRALIRDASIFKKMGIRENTLVKYILGRFGTEKVTQIAIHTGPIATDPLENSSYTFFVEQSVIDEKDLVEGDFITVHLRGVVVSDTKPIWVCENLVEVF